ncbi:hypothetical protein ACQ4PT_019660 [Festuca glaucescens]
MLPPPPSVPPYISPSHCCRLSLPYNAAGLDLPRSNPRRRLPWSTPPCSYRPTVSPPAYVFSSLQPPSPEPSSDPCTVARFLALLLPLVRRLVQLVVGDVFAVPGDTNLTLLHHLITEPVPRLVGYCNELHELQRHQRLRLQAHRRGLNAIAGTFSENLLVICLAWGLNYNDYGTNHILHTFTGAGKES